MIIERKKIIIDKLEYNYVGDKPNIFIIVGEIGKSRSTWICSNKDFIKATKKNPEKHIIDILLDLDRYYYLTDLEYKKFIKNIGYEKELNIFYNAEKKDLFKVKTFDLSKIMRVTWENHLFYNLDNKYPIALPYRIDYIGGVTNEYFDLDIAKKILEKHSYVSELKLIDIPYYNWDENHNKALEFVITLPQDEYNKLVHYWRDIKKNEFWSSRVKDSLIYKPYNKTKDYLGLKKAYKRIKE